MSRDGVVGTRARTGVQERGGSSGKSNGGTDIMVPFFQHKAYRLLEPEAARQELEAIMAGSEHLAGVFDFSDPAAPAAVRPCRRCKVPQRVELVVTEGPNKGRVIISALVLKFLAFLICEPCEEAEIEELAKVKRANDYAARLAHSGIPAALEKDAAKGWDDIIVRARTADDGRRRAEARDVMREWAMSNDPTARGVWLHGAAGSGKTKLVATAAVEKLRVMPLRWISVAVLIMQLDGAWNDDDRKAALKVLTDPGVVALDDLDKVTPSPRVQLALFTALEARDKAGSGILVTTNEQPSELARTFSSPMMSRLIKLATPMPYPGPDLRLEMVE